MWKAQCANVLGCAQVLLRVDAGLFALRFDVGSYVALRWFAEIDLALRHDSNRLLGHHRKAGHMRLESHVHCSYGNSSDPLHVRGC